MTNLVERLRAKSAELYSIRDRIGLKAKVHRLTVSHDGEPGENPPVLEVEQVLPSPSIVNLQVRREVTGHGDSGGGSLMLKGLAWENHTRESLGNGDEAEGEQFFWLVDGYTYQTDAIEQNFVSWNVTLRLNKVNFWDDAIPKK